MKRKISLEEYVERMIQEKNHNPRDYSFRLITSKHSKSCHTTFNFPGKYMEALKTNAYTDDGRNLRMDCAQLVQPGGFITRKSTINVEHQSSPLKQDKVETIYDYKLYLIHERNIPSNSIVITNIDPGKQTICYKSHDQIYNVHYIVVTKEEIEKRLNILSYKVKSNKPL